MLPERLSTEVGSDQVQSCPTKANLLRSRFNLGRFTPLRFFDAVCAMFVVLLKLEGLRESVALHLHGLIQASFAVEYAFKVYAFVDSLVLDLAW